MDTNKSDMIAKVQKLLRLSKSSNQHEAELAAQRASELMERYQIENSELEAQAVERGTEKVVSVRYVIPGRKLKVLWLNTLAHAAAKLYDGEILITAALHEQVVFFVGFESEVELMKSTFDHLYHAWHGIVEHDLERAKAESLEQQAYAYQPRDTMKFKHGHGQGYATALYQRCAKIAKDRKAHLQAAGNSCTALVLVRDTAISTWMNDRYGNKKHANFGRKATPGSSAGFGAGVRAGQSVGLGGSLKGGSVGGYLS